MTSPNLLTRRSFLRQCACAAVGTAGVAGALLDLRRMAAASLGNTDALSGDYRALVCLFLYGGNDANNLLVPAGADYAAYATARGGLALPQANVLPIAPITSDGRSFGLHSSLAELKGLFDQRKMAVVANVGTLVEPLTKVQYQNGTGRKPPQLFSHSDQQVQWQTSVPDVASRTGWGGRTGDLMRALNGSAQVSICVSIAGNNTFQIGENTVPYAVSSSGSVGLSNYVYPNTAGATNDTIRSRALDDLLAMGHTNLFEKTHAGIMQRSLQGGALLKGALQLTDPANGGTALATAFPNTGLGGQLKLVARLIRGRDVLGLRRQIFFVSVGGYDTHNNQLAAQAGLFAELSQALAAFHAATVEVGVADSVTSFTCSDFGRTYQTNGAGSDHGWGSHHLVVGGAVRGGDIYGRVPTLAVNGPDDTGNGRWIPTTAVDEYAATMARWFGVSATDLPTVLPNIGRFAHPSLGFV